MFFIRKSVGQKSVFFQRLMLAQTVAKIAANEEFAEVPIFRLFCYGKISHLRHFSKRMLFAVLMCFFHNL